MARTAVEPNCRGRCHCTLCCSWLWRQQNCTEVSCIRFVRHISLSLFCTYKRFRVCLVQKSYFCQRFCYFYVCYTKNDTCALFMHCCCCCCCCNCCCAGVLAATQILGGAKLTRQLSLGRRWLVNTATLAHRHTHTYMNTHTHTGARFIRKSIKLYGNGKICTYICFSISVPLCWWSGDATTLNTHTYNTHLNTQTHTPPNAECIAIFYLRPFMDKSNKSSRKKCCKHLLHMHIAACKHVCVCMLFK